MSFYVVTDFLSFLLFYRFISGTHSYFLEWKGLVGGRALVEPAVAVTT